MVEGNPRPQRLGSLDALRGFAMFLLLGGGGIGHAGFLKALCAAFDHPIAKELYQQFHYTHWGDGFHFKDLFMPLFIFVAGVSIPYSFGNRLLRGASKKDIYIRVLKRVILLCFLGTVAGGHLLAFDRSKFYLFNNVLQQIGIGYLVTSLIVLNFKIRGQLTAWVALLLGYWAVIMLAPVPGYGAGILTPEVNLPRYVDDVVLGGLRPVNWHWTWVLTLPMATSCTVLLGAMAGELLRSSAKRSVALGALVGAAAGCLLVSFLWGRWYPRVPEVWSGTWVLFVGGLSLAMLALFYLIIDIWGFRKWSFPLIVIGSNSIAVYMAAHLFDFRLIGNVFVGGLANWVGPGPWNNVLQTAAAFTVIWLILFWMYRTKTFVKV